MACERLGMDPDECSLRHRIGKEDIIKRYGGSLFPMQLRMVGEVLYQCGPGGVDGRMMLDLIVMRVRGERAQIEPSISGYINF